MCSEVIDHTVSSPSYLKILDVVSIHNTMCIVFLLPAECVFWNTFYLSHSGHNSLFNNKNILLYVSYLRNQRSERTEWTRTHFFTTLKVTAPPPPRFLSVCVCMIHTDTHQYLPLLLRKCTYTSSFNLITIIRSHWADNNSIICLLKCFLTFNFFSDDLLSVLVRYKHETVWQQLQQQHLRWSN